MPLEGQEADNSEYNILFALAAKILDDDRVMSGIVQNSIPEELPAIENPLNDAPHKQQGGGCACSAP